MDGRLLFAPVILDPVIFSLLRQTLGKAGSLRESAIIRCDFTRWNEFWTIHESIHQLG